MMDELEFMTSFSLGAAFVGFVWWISFSPTDIRDYRDKPYCESKQVAGKEVKLCLRAIEEPTE